MLNIRPKYCWKFLPLCAATQAQEQVAGKNGIPNGLVVSDAGTLKTMTIQRGGN